MVVTEGHDSGSLSAHRHVFELRLDNALDLLRVVRALMFREVRFLFFLFFLLSYVKEQS